MCAPCHASSTELKERRAKSLTAIDAALAAQLATAAKVSDLKRLTVEYIGHVLFRECLTHMLGVGLIKTGHFFEK